MIVQIMGIRVGDSSQVWQLSVLLSIKSRLYLSISLISTAISSE
jgi:hypothetical protein